MEIVDYEILVQELVPPIGPNQKYFAVIQFLNVKSANGKESINPELGETYGQSEGVARHKMQKKFDDWVQTSKRVAAEQGR